MKHILSFIIVFTLISSPAMAGEVNFLETKIYDVEQSVICVQDEDCKTLFLISGRNFLNSQDEFGVLIGGEWGDVLRHTDDFLMVTASESAYGKTPIISFSTDIQRPSLVSDDVVLEQMFEESVDVAIASIGISDEGQRYVKAGPKYGSPERTYYRDSYWTSGMVLMIEPYVIRDQILLLARGIEPNGSVPSAIPVDPDDIKIPLWADHQDSGPYFIMLVYDYIRYTGDASILSEVVNGRSIFTAAEDVVTYLSTKDTNGNYLPEKPEGSLQDWLDSIPRSGEVFSNQVLYYRALRNLVELAGLMDKPRHATVFHRYSLLVRYSVNSQFWNDEDGYYYEKCEGSICTERVTNESSLAVLYGIASESQAERLFENLKILETRNNALIPYGDWGVVNAWPLYDGFTKHSYQNGTDWPFLDGMNAGARLVSGNEDWYYPLTRWWTYNQEQDAEKVLPEYVSPVDIHAGDLQAWSVNPIVSFVRYGLGIDPKMNGEYQVDSTMVGDSRIENIVLRGERTSLNILSQ
jgi:glycogen debranching enzyme